MLEEPKGKIGNSDIDMVIGRLIRLAVVQAPHIAKIWNNLANWSLELGEKTLSSCDGNRIELTGEEKEIISSSVGDLRQIAHF